MSKITPSKTETFALQSLGYKPRSISPHCNPKYLIGVLDCPLSSPALSKPKFQIDIISTHKFIHTYTYTHICILSFAERVQHRSVVCLHKDAKPSKYERVKPLLP